MTLVSIIVPFYNSEQSLGRCINSIVNQTYANLEIILVDDGSTDNSLVICRKYSERDSRIKTIYKKHEGVSKARNTGINASQGDWIAFVDSDDWIDFEFITTLLRFSNDTDIVICNCAYNKEYEGNYIAEFIDTGAKTVSGTACHQKIIRANVIKNNKVRFPSNFSYGEDTLFSLYILQYCNRIKQIEYHGYHFTPSAALVSEKYNQSIQDINDKISALQTIHERLGQRFNQHFDISYDIRMTIMMFPMERILNGEYQEYEQLWLSYFPNTTVAQFCNDRYCSPMIRSITYMKCLAMQKKYRKLYATIKKSVSLWGERYGEINYPYPLHQRIGMQLGHNHSILSFLSLSLYSVLKI